MVLACASGTTTLVKSTSNTAMEMPRLTSMRILAQVIWLPLPFVNNLRQVMFSDDGLTEGHCYLVAYFQEEFLRYLIALLAIAGIIVSGLALRVHYSTETAPCSINEKWDCGIVNHSPYAEIWGIPVATIGITGYFLIGVLAFLRRRMPLLLAALGGMAFALYLTNIEAKVLGVWCLYCVISQGIIAVITLLAIGWTVWHAMRRGVST